MADTREVIEGTQEQGEDESVVYTIDVSNVGDGPSVPVLTVKDEGDDWDDVTEVVTATSGGTVSVNIITLPAISGLTQGNMYRCEVAFTLGGNDLEHYFRVHAKR